MHDHETCEELMAAAQRASQPGRLEYLSWRCDKKHGDLTTTEPHATGCAADDEEMSDV